MSFRDRQKQFADRMEGKVERLHRRLDQLEDRIATLEKVANVEPGDEASEQPLTEEERAAFEDGMEEYL